MNHSPENTFRPKRVADALGVIGLLSLVAWLSSSQENTSVLQKIQAESAAVLIDTNN